MMEGFKTSISAEEIETLECASFGGKIVLIEDAGRDFARAFDYLRRQKVLGFDTETKPVFEAHAPHNSVALLQISSGETAFLFRLNKMGMRRRLCKLLANPTIIKVGAAVHDDIRGLQRLRNFEAAGFVDLQKMVGDFGITDRSVRKMAAIILGVRISKTQQLSNWEAPQLSESQKRYAATDAWVCVKMYEKLLAARAACEAE